MARVTIDLPSLLQPMVGGRGSIPLDAETLEEALKGLLREHPELRVHLYQESGAFREHVLCFHNETNTRWMEDLSVTLSDGDTITILQAVSGG